VEPEGELPDTQWLERLLAATEQAIRDSARDTPTPARKQLVADLGAFRNRVLARLRHLNKA
jgi:hypothetical protein